MGKKKKNEIVDDLAIPFTFAGGAIGSSVLGGAMDSFIPVGTANPLAVTGTTMSRFQSPITALSAGNIIFKQMRKIERRIK